MARSYDKKKRKQRGKIKDKRTKSHTGGIRRRTFSLRWRMQLILRRASQKPLHVRLNVGTGHAEPRLFFLDLEIVPAKRS